MVASGFAAKRIHITGVVQGVGFRPSMYAMAKRLGLTGWVCNTSSGVDIEVNGPEETLNRFVRDLSIEAPPLSHIDFVSALDTVPNGSSDFAIRDSVAELLGFQPVSPDIALCDDCRRE